EKGLRATGSWNIQDEIRRVRSKATEELLGPYLQQELIVSEKTQYELQKEALPLPAIISSEQNQDSDVAAIDGKGGSQNALEGVSTTGQRLKASEDMKTAPSDTVAGDFGGQKNSNGTEQRNTDIGGTSEVTSSHEKVAVDLTVEEEAHEFFNNATVEVANKNENDGVPLSEASIEVPESIENYMDVTKDNDFVATGSQNSSSMADEYFFRS
ncbi:hypothetical protein Prudu_003924, partial [Prunus dulcis]